MENGAILHREVLCSEPDVWVYCALGVIGWAILEMALVCSVLRKKGPFIAHMAVVCSECAPRGAPKPSWPSVFRK